MPHLRIRHIQESFDKLIRHARILGLLGHRQVGKTTFLQQNASEYVTLDDEATLLEAQRSPSSFVAKLKGKRSGIDECQLVPGLFPALKVKIGTSSTPGRYILSGSVRFTSRKAIRESLTGRIMNLEMLPFTMSEIENEPNPSFFPRLIAASSIVPTANSSGMMHALYRSADKSIASYLKNGGLPGLFHIREKKTQQSVLRDLIETILDRDIRLVYKTSLPYQQIFEYCREIALDPLRVVHPTSLRQRLRMAESTQKNLLYALEGVFLFRRIPVEGDYRGDLFWLEDQIERRYFTENDALDDADWSTLVYRNLRAQFSYRVGEHARYFHYRTRGGAMVPFCVQTTHGILGVYPIQSRTDFNRSLKKSAESLLKSYNNSKVVFITREGKAVEAINDRIGIFPAQMALF